MPDLWLNIQIQIRLGKINDDKQSTNVRKCDYDHRLNTQKCICVFCFVFSVFNLHTTLEHFKEGQPILLIKKQVAGRSHHESSLK